MVINYSSPKLIERFWKKVTRDDSTEGCWLWTASVRPDGYGRFQLNGVTQDGSHRVAWRLMYGEIPPGNFVLHKCDVPLCVRPDHLFLGTPRDNMIDKVSKGRDRTKYKLSKEDFDIVFRLRLEGWSQQKIGDHLGVSQVMVSRILLGKSKIRPNRPSKQ